MSEKYTNGIIDSAKKYLFKLQYLANNDNKTLHDIHLLEIINGIYQWADWYEVSESDKIKIRKIMDYIIFKNSNLILPSAQFEKYYSNVNIPQTIWDWQRVYDRIDTTYVGNYTPFLLDENGDKMILESGEYIHFETY